MFPFAQPYDESTDEALVQEACQGSKAALEQLVRIHQRFIYNLALKLVRDTDDAADLTQEVLIKMVTKLGQYKHNSQFRTWLYRLVMNHFVSSKRRKAETQFASFSQLGVFIDQVHQQEDMSDYEQQTYREQIQQVRDRCMASMLLCLDRQQRMVFVLGAIFNLRSTTAARLLGISPENFRQQLSRAKADLFQFMDHKCGLINPTNPCRCHKKTKGFIAEGKVSAHTRQFTPAFTQRIDEVTSQKNQELDSLMEGKYLAFFRQQPYEDNAHGEALIQSLWLDTDIKQLFGLN